MIAKLRTLTKKARLVKRKAFSALMCFKPAYRLYRNRRAVSAVISNLILIAAVITVGFVALAYVRSTSADFQADYAQTTNSDIDRLKETVSFENVYYKASESKLYIYFINAGTISNLEIKSIVVSNSISTATISVTQMSYLDGTLTTGFGVGEQGCIAVTCSPALTGGSYTVKVTTGRDSSFATNFMA